ncbi:unnamed protein product [Heterobilharzia americana]|nr:unnamed protein product [Heterobilharzia americana]CAH8601326.1 unnamed protein product [Heterobilharzia americana]
MSQSNPNSTDVDINSENSNTDSHGNESVSSTENHEDLIHARLKSLAPECDSVKSAYDLCFQEFFPTFLQGHSIEKDPCETKLKVYQNCLREALKTSFDMDLSELDSIQTDAETIRNIVNNTT